MKPEYMCYEEERSDLLDRLFTLLKNIENDNMQLLIPCAHDR